MNLQIQEEPFCYGLHLTGSFIEKIFEPFLFGLFAAVYGLSAHCRVEFPQGFFLGLVHPLGYLDYQGHMMIPSQVSVAQGRNAFAL